MKIDDLEIAISAQASSVTKEIDDLYNKLGDLATVLGNTSKGYSKTATQVNRLVKAMQNLAVIRMPDLSYFANQLKSLNIDEATTKAVSAVAKLAGVGSTAQETALALPALTTALRDMMMTMSQFDSISDNTVRMTNAIARLAGYGSKVAGAGGAINLAFNKMTTSSRTAHSALSKLQKIGSVAGTAFQKMASMAKGAATGLARGAKTIVSHMMKIGKSSEHVNKATLSLKSLLGAALGFYGIRTLFDWGKQAIELSSDLTEVQNVVENSFGTAGTSAVENFTKTSIEQFGMAELAAKRISSRYQAMGNAMGLTLNQMAEATANVSDRIVDDYKKTDDGIAQMSLNLTKLAADMASFYNVEQETVAESLNAVYTGQTRPLRQFGLDLTIATLQEWALKQGIDANIQSMSQAEKTLLRYQYVMANTTNIQ